MTDLLQFAIAGFALGCIYALMGAGLVLTHRTTGVFNLAFGAQAFASAAVFYELRIEHEWGTLPAFAVAVLVVGVLSGLLLDRLVFRRLRSAPVVARLVAALGLLVAIPAAVEIWFGSGTKFNPPSLAPDPSRVYRFGNYAINAHQVTAVVATLVVVVAVAALLRWTGIGLRMRAMVESPRLAELHGVDADRVGATAWALSSVMAGIAGVLLAPVFSGINSVNFTILLVAAIAAATFGRLTSLGLTLAGGVVLGVAQQVLAGYLPLNSVLAQGLRPSLPFVMLLLILLLAPGLGRSRATTDPLAGVDPPRPSLRSATTDRRTRLASDRLQLGVQIAAGIAFVIVTMVVVSDLWVFRLTEAVALATIFLSITVVTGFGGQISLSQAAFAGIGAFTAGQLATRWDVSVFGGVLAGAFLAAVAGAVLAVPVRRLSGIYVALATLAFALMVENILFPLDWVGGADFGVTVPRPLLGSIDFGGDREYFLLSVAVFAVAAVATVLVRRGTIGLYLAALRGSEVGAAASGVSPARMKILAFAISGAIAGAGGVVYAARLPRIAPSDFSFFLGFFWVVLVVTLGIRTVAGAAAGGLAWVLVPEILDGLGLPVGLTFVIFGLAAIGLVGRGEGVVESGVRAAADRVARLFGRPARKRAVATSPDTEARAA